MDEATQQRLRILPVDLGPLGWTLVPVSLEPVGHAPGVRYQVVYERTVQPEDDIGNVDRSGHIRVVGASPASWDDAYWQAVVAMRQVDAARKP